MLYNLLGAKECVVFGDTDSIVYIHRPCLPDPLLDDYLGDFKDELSHGDYIVEFASGGPKNYGYVTAKGKEECKVHGLSLNSEGSCQMNYQVLCQNPWMTGDWAQFHPLSGRDIISLV